MDFKFLKDTIFDFLGFEYDGEIEFKRMSGVYAARNGGKAIVGGENKSCVCRALAEFIKCIKEGKNEFEVVKKPRFEYCGSMLDMSRDGVLRVETVKEYLNQQAVMGLNMMMLYTEDIFEMKKYPFFGYKRGRYTLEELKEIDDYADSLGIEMIPCVQTLGHLGNYLKWAEAGPVRDTAQTLLAGEAATYEFIEEIIKTMRKAFRSNHIHIGMDEAGDLGTGAYLKKHRGEVLDQGEVFMKHLDKVCSICEKYEYKPMIWSDLMFSVGRPDIAEIYPDDGYIPDEVKERLPDVRLMYWYYSAGTKERYATFLQRHKDSGKNIAFAGGGWNWDGYFPNIDFTIKSMVPALDACIEVNPGFVLNTLWGNGGCETPFELCCHSNALFAEYQYGGEVNAVENAYSFCDIMFGIPKKMMDACETVNLKQRDNIRISRKLMSVDVLGAVHQPVDAFYYIENMPDIFKDAEPQTTFLKAAEEIDEYILEHGDIKEYFELISTVLKICADKAFVYAELQKAYKNNDKKTLSHIRDNVLPRLSYLYKKFYKLQKQQWLREYKVFGWEKDCQKIGFQIIRIDYATEVLDDYLLGRIDKIEELEAETLNQNIVEYDQRMYAPIQSK